MTRGQKRRSQLAALTLDLPPAPLDDAPAGTRPRIVALVPAHDEQRALPEALASLRDQTTAPDRIVVVADNCTDDTVPVARRHGAEVLETVGNTDRKAGALGQALDALLPALADDDLLLVADADSMLVTGFVETALRTLRDDHTVGAVGGVFHGEAGSGLVGALQRNEYSRYAREIARRADRATVLTGTATLFRVGVLREVAAARGTRLPGPAGRVYDPAALTEDNEITLAVRTLGWRTVSPPGCGVLTEIMPTWADLWRQRLRWQRGALENLRGYGLNVVTAPYLARQAGMYAGIVAVGLFLLATALFATAGLLGPPTGLWIAVTAVFVVERVWTVRARGWRGMALALPMVVEFGYDLFQQAVFLRAAADALRGDRADWHHLAPSGA
ncbi:glycosyltransferase family 2 protein [Pseudonocardia dioxanivorans]|uniref:glycosyltransferase n=1 Tax=Pseudonocardia dioxanivorans TaxID=240495 RepID=UPI000CD30C2C|nr:glycosyltransferase family 2 protein [Pseudonocardia dioxanivorans]